MTQESKNSSTISMAFATKTVVGRDGLPSQTQAQADKEMQHPDGQAYHTSDPRHSFEPVGVN